MTLNLNVGHWTPDLSQQLAKMVQTIKELKYGNKTVLKYMQNLGHITG